MPLLSSRKGLVAAAIGGIAASVCCVGPLLLLSLGISGAWITQLTAFEPFRPYLIAVTLALLAYAGYLTYRRAPRCAAGASCDVAGGRRQRLMFWIVGIVIVALLAFPYYANWFID